MPVNEPINKRALSFRKRSFIFFALVFIISAVPFSAFCVPETPAILDIRLNKNTVEKFALFELTVDVRATYDNPFDPEDIDVEAVFISPGGKAIMAHAFFYQDFQRSRVNGAEKLEKSGQPVWKIRFTPVEEGRYRYALILRDRTGMVSSESRSLMVKKPRKEGFIRRSPKNNHYLAFDSGKDYFAVGESVGWAARNKQTYDYDYFFDKLAQNGCNYSRVWTVGWGLGLEWDSLGKYSLENAWRLDHILNLAEEKGIYVLLTLGNYGDLMAQKGYWKEERWLYNPYNAANGGPCGSPEEFWANSSARDFYKKRLRYIIARWGHSTNLLSWEFWNEAASPQAWISEMSGYVKELDPFGHLVTTSIAGPESADYSEEGVYKTDGIDFTQVHLYGYQGKSNDLISELYFKCRKNLEKYAKPCLIAEFGIDSGRDDAFYDRSGKGVNLHNGLWAAVFSGAPGTAMNWWWDSYVDSKNLYAHYGAVARFVKSIDWSKEPWSVLEVGSLKKDPAGSPRVYSDVTIAARDEWGKADASELYVKNNGEISGGVLNKYLHGISKEDLRVNPCFKVDYPAAGKFIVTIGTVSQGAKLNVYVDDRKALEKELPAAERVSGKEGKGEYKKEWDIWWCAYDEDFSVEIAPGPHVIRLENTGIDWVTIDKVTLTNYKDSFYPDARVIGLKRPGEAILWVHNRENDWYNNYKGVVPQAIKDLSFEISEMLPGTYEVDWWDTYKGEITRKETVQSVTGRVTLRIPELSTDIAGSVKKRF